MKILDEFAFFLAIAVDAHANGVQQKRCEKCLDLNGQEGKRGTHNHPAKNSACLSHACLLCRLLFISSTIGVAIGGPMGMRICSTTIRSEPSVAGFACRISSGWMTRHERRIQKLGHNQTLVAGPQKNSVLSSVAIT